MVSSFIVQLPQSMGLFVATLVLLKTREAGLLTAEVCVCFPQGFCCLYGLFFCLLVSLISCDDYHTKWQSMSIKLKSDSCVYMIKLWKWIYNTSTCMGVMFYSPELACKIFSDNPCFGFTLTWIPCHDWCTQRYSLTCMPPYHWGHK